MRGTNANNMSNCKTKPKPGILWVLIVFIMVLSIVLILAVRTAAGTERSGQESYYYTSVCIQHGDTLWSIAEKYSKKTGIPVREYLEKLKKMNGISGDKIQAGSYLTVAYTHQESQEVQAVSAHSFGYR